VNEKEEVTKLNKSKGTSTRKRYSLEAYVICIIAMIATIIMAMEVVGRYVFQHSFSWSEEIVRYVFIWFTMIGASYAIKEKKHICIDGLANILPPKARRAVLIIGETLLLAILLFLFYKSLEYTLFTMRTMSRATVTKLPMHFIYAGMPIGFLMSAFRLVQSWILAYRSGMKEE